MCFASSHATPQSLLRSCRPRWLGGPCLRGAICNGKSLWPHICNGHWLGSLSHQASAIAPPAQALQNSLLETLVTGQVRYVRSVMKVDAVQGTLHPTSSCLIVHISHRRLHGVRVLW